MLPIKDKLITITSIRPTARGFVGGDWSQRACLIRIRPTTLRLRTNSFYLQLLNLPPPCARTAATDSQGNTTGWSGCQ